MDDVIDKFILVPEFDTVEEFIVWMDNLKPEDYTHSFKQSKLIGD